MRGHHSLFAGRSDPHQSRSRVRETPYHLTSKIAQPAIAWFKASISNIITLVIGELNDTHARLMEGIEQTQVPSQHLRILKTQDQPQFARCFSTTQVMGWK